MSGQTPKSCLDQVQWNADGLVPVITQAAETGRVLMLAWMNRQALRQTIDSGYATYWSRSRAALWRKGESSGNLQRVVELSLDCDNDALLMQVEQIGGVACHTGRRSCFFQVLDAGRWKVHDEPIKDPAEMYDDHGQNGY